MGDKEEQQSSVSAVVIAIAVIGGLALIVIIYLLYKKFMEETKEAELFDKFVGIVKDTVRIAFPLGGMAALKSQQDEEVKERMDELIQERRQEREGEDIDEEELAYKRSQADRIDGVQGMKRRKKRVGFDADVPDNQKPGQFNRKTTIDERRRNLNSQRDLINQELVNLRKANNLYGVQDFKQKEQEYIDAIKRITEFLGEEIAGDADQGAVSEASADQDDDEEYNDIGQQLSQLLRSRQRQKIAA